MDLLNVFMGELEKIARTRWQKEWANMSPEERSRILTAAREPTIQQRQYEAGLTPGAPAPQAPAVSTIPQMAARGGVAERPAAVRAIREGLFAPTGKESRVVEPRSELLRRRALAQYSPEPVLSAHAVRSGPIAVPTIPGLSGGLSRDQLALPRIGSTELGKSMTPAQRRSLDILSPSHELAELRSISRPGARERFGRELAAQDRIGDAAASAIKARKPLTPEMEHDIARASTVSQRRGKPFTHHGAGVFTAEHEAGYGSPGAQRTALQMRTRPVGGNTETAYDKPWIQSLKERGWTPQTGLPERPGQIESVEARAAHKAGPLLAGVEKSTVQGVRQLNEMAPHIKRTVQEVPSEPAHVPVPQAAVATRPSPTPAQVPIRPTVAPMKPVPGVTSQATPRVAPSPTPQPITSTSQPVRKPLGGVFSRLRGIGTRGLRG